MRFLPPAALLVLALAAAGTARADKFYLKGGEKLEGRILSQTATEYTIEYKATATITDSRVVAKADVEKIDREQPDEALFLQLKGLQPGANSLPVAGYDGPMRSLQAFLNLHPKSTHAAEVGGLLTAFAEEKKRVEGGEIKIGGRWIAREEAEKERHQLLGSALYGQMQEQARRGDFVGALNTFDQIEKTYRGAAIMPDAIELDRQVLTQLKASAERAAQTWAIQKQERDAGTQLLSEPKKSELIAIQRAEEAQLLAAAEAATKSGVKWAPFQPKNEKGLAALITAVPLELKRLETAPVAKMRNSIQLAEKARAALRKSDAQEAEDSLRQAITLWSANEVAQRLQKQVGPLKATLAKNATPVPTDATPKATPLARATPSPDATPAPAAQPVVHLEEEPKPFLSSPLGLGVVAVLLLGGAGGYYAYQKKKKAAEAEFE